MWTSRWTPLVLLSVAGLVACGGGDQQAQTKEDQQVAGEKAQPQRAATEEVSVTLSPKNQSGIRGKAVIGRRGDSIQVRLMLSGLDAGSSYPAHVHEGTCKAGGGVARALTKVAARDSTATSRSTFPASVVSPDSAYFLQAHLPDGTPAACGNVPTGAFGSSGGM